MSEHYKRGLAAIYGESMKARLKAEECRLVDNQERQIIWLCEAARYESQCYAGTEKLNERIALADRLLETIRELESVLSGKLQNPHSLEETQ